jgi:hypothetical protein
VTHSTALSRPLIPKEPAGFTPFLGIRVEDRVFRVFAPAGISDGRQTYLPISHLKRTAGLPVREALWRLSKYL